MNDAAVILATISLIVSAVSLWMNYHSFQDCDRISRRVGRMEDQNGHHRMRV